MSGCSHKGHWLKMCSECSEKKPYMVFRLGAKGGYFWGDGFPEEALRGEQPHWMTPIVQTMKCANCNTRPTCIPAPWAWCGECLATLPKIRPVNVPISQGGQMYDEPEQPKLVPPTPREVFDICWRECMQIAKETNNI